MITELSILLPTYNNTCLTLVRDLHRQASAIDGLDFEILVADDGSSDKRTLETNHAINLYENCKLMECNVNRGRARIRNFLAEMAQYKWLLFMDSDVKVNNGFILRYLEAGGSSDVVCGGMTIPLASKHWQRNLRYCYERSFLAKHTTGRANQHPYQSFRSTNFMVRQDVMRSHKFNCDITTYGYEDVLLGRDFEQDDIAVSYIDNPVMVDSFDSNAEFLEKTKSSCLTLYLFRQSLKGYSALLDTMETANKMHLSPLLANLFRWRKESLEKRLAYGKPSVFLYNIYRMGCLANLFANKEQQSS